MTDRDRRVIKVANSVICRSVYKMPVDIERICKSYGILMAPSSVYIEAGYSEEIIFDSWGNKDGLAVSIGRVNTINYNDKQPGNRMRFTMAEELMHILLGHSKDKRFDIRDQSYTAEVYAQYEWEAKHGAGMVLVPPSIYYKYRKMYDLSQIARLCQVSHACAYTVAKYYEECEDEISVLFTHKHIECDTSNLIPRISYKPMNVGAPLDAML